MSELPDNYNKDLLYLEDALSWELLAKKAYHLCWSQDPIIRQHLEHLASVHQQHYQTLLKHLQTHSQQQSTQYQNNQYRN